MISGCLVTLHHHLITNDMLTNEQMEKLWWKYQREGIEKNLSLQAFCSIHNVPYNAFEKFLKLRRHLSDVHPVTVTGLPSGIPDAPAKDDGEAIASACAGNVPSPSATRIMISIRMTNGIQISKRNMDYQGLRSLVERLEALC